MCLPYFYIYLISLFPLLILISSHFYFLTHKYTKSHNHTYRKKLNQSLYTTSWILRITLAMLFVCKIYIASHAFSEIFHFSDLSLLVKRTRMEWETMPTPDLINLANKLSCTQDESPQRKTTKIHLQLQQMKAPKWNQNNSSFCYFCKDSGHWKLWLLQI